MEEKQARIAGRAHGVVDRGELLAAGITEGQIRERLRTGALLPEFPGVYRVGHRAPSVEATYTAAVKACGNGALLRRLAAAYLYGLLRGAKQAPPPELAAPSAGSRESTCAAHAASTPRGDHVQAHVALSPLEDASSRSCAKAGLPLPATNRPAGTNASTTAGPSTTSPSSSKATATTTPATPGSKTAAANAKPAPAETSSARYTWDDTTKDNQLVLRELRTLLRQQ